MVEPSEVSTGGALRGVGVQEPLPEPAGRPAAVEPRSTPGGPAPAAAPVEDAVECSHVAKVYRRGVYALRDLCVTIPRGDFVFLTGPSGAGKSTLLRLLLREEVPSAGELIVEGRDLAKLRRWQVQAYRRTLGFVFQDFKLIPRHTVLENVAFVLRVLGVPLDQQRRRTFQVLKWVGLQHRLNAYPAELSGGEQQRVAIARAVVNEPNLILADEPTGNLDPDLSLEIMNLFREIHARGATVVVATHDRELIRRVGRRAITLDHGRIVDVS
jgi:cell division transport system ATP-binding protein